MKALIILYFPNRHLLPNTPNAQKFPIAAILPAICIDLTAIWDVPAAGGPLEAIPRLA